MMDEQEFEDLWENAEPIEGRPGWWINKETGNTFCVTTTTLDPFLLKHTYPIVYETYTVNIGTATDILVEQVEYD